MSFTCNMTKAGDTARFQLAGQISEQAAEELKSRFRSLGGGTKIIVLDFAEVSHIGSAGIGKLLLMYKDLAVAGGEVRIEQIPGGIYETFRALKLDSLFTLLPKDRV